MKNIADQGKHLLLFSVMLLAALSIALSSCGGGGGGGGGGAASGPPFIAAELESFPTGSVPSGFAPAGFNSAASVAVLDDSSGASVTTATVLMNGVPLTYDATNQDYEGNVAVAPGGAVNLSVTVGGSTYMASATQFASYPTISAPASGATLDSHIANTVTWSGGAPNVNAVYALGVLDAAHSNGQLIWPLDHFIQDVPIPATSFSIPAFDVTGGNRLVLAGIFSPEVAIPNAAPGSSLIVGGFNYVPVTVTGMPVTSRTSDPATSLTGITWSGSQFVAVGFDGTGKSILTSPDGITWTSRTSGTLNFLQGVTWSGTQFVAVGENGTILTSPDGIAWISRTSGTSNHLFGVTWSGTQSQFVAVGRNGNTITSPGTILTSPDGITWTPQNSGVFSSLFGVTWSGTQFVAVGANTSLNTVLTSPDGVTWTLHAPAASPTLRLNSVIWSGTQFVAVGKDNGPCSCGIILTSANGIAWTTLTSGTSDDLLGVAWSGAQFVAVGGAGTGVIFTSPDGATWTRQASGTTNVLHGVVWSGAKFVIVGSRGTILTSP
jgi:hypothetical protein